MGLSFLGHGMRRLLLVVGLLLGAGSASAISPVENDPRPEGFDAQQATYFGTEFLSVIRKDTAYPHAGLVHVKWDVYFPDPSSSQTPGVRVDYIRYNAVINCSSKGAWRADSWAGYAEGKASPVIQGKDAEDAWRANAEGSPGFATWEGICRDRFDETEMSFPKGMHPDQVLKHYRQNLLSGG